MQESRNSAGHGPRTDGGFLIPPKPLVRRCLSLPLLSLPSSYFPSALALSSSLSLPPPPRPFPRFLSSATKQNYGAGFEKEERERTASARRRHWPKATRPTVGSQSAEERKNAGAGKGATERTGPEGTAGKINGDVRSTFLRANVREFSSSARRKRSSSGAGLSRVEPTPARNFRLLSGGTLFYLAKPGETWPRWFHDWIRPIIPTFFSTMNRLQNRGRNLWISRKSC